MKPFKAYTYHWWELGLLKFSLIALGILIGSYFADFFRIATITLILWLIFALPALYLIIVSLKQANKD